MNEKSLKISDIIEIEKELNVKLPEFYKKVLLNYPFVGPNYYDFCDDDLYNSKERIIKTNKKIKIEGFQNDEWPSFLFIIGDDHCGDYYVINLNSIDTNIYYADHETDFSEKNYKEHILHYSIEEFIIDNIELNKEIDESLQ